MSKKILSLILCLSLLMSLFTLSVSAAGNEMDNDINFGELGKIEDVTLTSIEVSKVPTKVDYLEGLDALDVTGGKVKLIYSDESFEEIDMTADMVTGFDNTVVGSIPLTVTYEGFTVTFYVVIYAKTLTGIELTTLPAKLNYVEGKDDLDVSGGKVTLHYDNGTSEEIDLTADMVTGYYKDGAGEQTITVTYAGRTATYKVTVNHDYADATCGDPATCKGCGATTGSATGKHDYKAATCTEAKTCKVCGATSGKANGHDYKAATCTEAKTCKVCKATSGKANGHDYKAATCTAPKTCKVCKATSGKANGHSYKAATCTAPKTCKVCKATSGKALGHKYETTTKKATLTKNGSIVKACSRCDKVSSKTTIRYAKTIKLSTTSYTYNGKAKKPTVTVKDSAGKTISSKYYTVTYASGRKNVGTYKVTVKFKTRYSGSKTLTFKINPPKTTVKKLTAAKKSLKVSITKKSSQVSGYQVQYSTSKKFTKATTKTVKSYKTTSYTIKSLSAKKTYYVRIRTYKTVNGKKYYSGWSTAKSKKTK